MKKLPYERPIIQKLNTGLMNKYGMRTEYEPLTHIDGQPVSALVERYGSPLFVLSERTIRQTYKDALRAFSTRYPKVQFAWSYKTNYLSAVCQVYHQEGSWAEVVSGFEYRKALEHKVPGNRIIFNGPDKSREELKLAVANQSMIHIDHQDELYELTELAAELGARPRVAVRVNMDTGVYPLWDRFGFNYEDGQAAAAIRKIMEDDKLELLGLHCHIGTFMLTPSAYAQAAAKLSELALSVKKRYGKALQYLDLGGGFASRNTLKGSYLQGQDACPTFDQYAEAICTAIHNAGFGERELPLLILETGRALVDEAGYLIGTVVSNKRLADGRRATILDFGVNILFTSFWYDHRISPAQPFGSHTEDAILYGPLCMNIDVVREHISLPPLKRGDQVVTHTVGAYNMTQWMQFITLRPAVVMIAPDGSTHLVRRREELESIQREELIPPHLLSN